uniref:Uncharacterized protein n=1 Tax=Penaeus semisulcatus majanivirus TaxID=2984274 RepID=A0A9C7EYC5_9VIRU|nr:MAG: hypothetical protein [Penaeus semisulcatus majanivirus]
MPSHLAGLEDPSTPSEGTTVEQPLMSSGGAEGEEVERGEKMDPDNLSSPSVENNEADQRSQPQPQSKSSPMPELKPLPRTQCQSPQMSQYQSFQMTQNKSPQMTQYQFPQMSLCQFPQTSQCQFPQIFQCHFPQMSQSQSTQMPQKNQSPQMPQKNQSPQMTQKNQSPQMTQYQSTQMSQTLSMKAVHSPTIKVFSKKDEQPITLQGMFPRLDGRALEPEYDIFIKITCRDGQPNPM